MIISQFNQHVHNQPNKVALIINDDKWTYADLSVDIQKTIIGFSEIGIGKGTHVGLLLGNSYQFVLSLLAAAAIGAVIVPLNKTMKSHALATMINTCDITFFIAEKAVVNSVLVTQLVDKKHIISTDYYDENIHYFEQWLLSPAGNDNLIPSKGVSGDDNFIITTTSGSTGDPKPILLTQATKIKRANNAQALYALNEHDVIIAATPLYHSLALRLCLLPLLLGATSVILPKFSPTGWLNAIAKYHVSFSILVSSQLSNVLLEYKKNIPQYHLASLRTLVSSSALIQSALKRELIEYFDCNIHEIYGASEVGVVTNLSPEDTVNKIDTVGRAVDGVDIKIRGQDKKILTSNTVGEITCQSDMAFSGYYTAENEVSVKKNDQYFYTGDLGTLDDEGFLRFVGRQKDIIITGGINTYPSDIEQVLMDSTLLKECAVIGVDDKHLGEAVVAVVVPLESSEKIVRKLQRVCYQHLEDYQQPIHYELVDTLPKNAIGKIDKMAIRERFSDVDASTVLRNILS